MTRRTNGHRKQLRADYSQGTGEAGPEHQAAYDKIRGCTTGKKMKALKQETLFEVRLALMNCLGLIDDLR